MKTTTATPLSELYEQDETAWLDQMARLAAEGRCPEFDLDNLSEFLTSMANRDRREVSSHLRILMAHLLKYEHQPRRRTTSWRLTIHEQRSELQVQLASATLRNFATEDLQASYRKARERAAVETKLPIATFPMNCPWTLEQLLADEN